jgi:hypothetical protein
MATYGDMQTRIADELANDGGITTAQIQKAILTTIADYAGEQFWFNEAVGTFNTVAAQELYTSTDYADIPNIIKVISVRLATSGSYNGYINGVTNDSIEDMQDGSISGAPQYYSRFANKLRLYPIPNAVYSIKLSYITTLTALSADADTNAWTNDAEEVIRQGAKKRLAADILASDEIANRCAAMEAKAYEGLRAENRNRRSQQFLRTEVPGTRRTFNIYSGW